jgi:hypothetical protein
MPTASGDQCIRFSSVSGRGTERITPITGGEGERRWSGFHSRAEEVAGGAHS